MTEGEFELSRRDLLRYAAQGAALVGTGGLLTTGSRRVTRSSAVAAMAPRAKRGGTLQAGLSGGSRRDTLDPQNWVNLVDGARVYSLFNPLVDFDLDAHPVLSLADELEASSDAMKWTIRVKPDIEFHNGKTLSADDVLFTFQRIVNPKTPALGAISLKALDIANAKKIDKYTIQIPCFTPFSPLKDILCAYHFFVVPVGFDLKNPVGTGPFKYESFTPGQQSTFVKNENYWESGLPYIDKLVISDFPDEVSQVNGLNGGTLDVIDLLSADSIAPVRSGGNNVIITKGGSYTPFTMRVDQPPFDDVRVRQAFRLICDRNAMLRTVFSGYGTIGNDVFGLWDAVYDTKLAQRVQGIDEAKSLLKKAGHSNLTVTLVTSAIGSGTVQVAQVLKQQAAAAGVTVNLKEVTSSEFFGPNYLSWTFAQDYWNYYPYFSNVLQGTLAGAPFNECHTNNATYTSLYKQAVATLDETKRANIAHEMQEMEYSGVASGYIIPYFNPVIDGYSSHVHGVVSSKTGLPLGAYGFKNMWLSGGTSSAGSGKVTYDGIMSTLGADVWWKCNDVGPTLVDSSGAGNTGEGYNSTYRQPGPFGAEESIELGTSGELNVSSVTGANKSSNISLLAWFMTTNMCGGAIIANGEYSPNQWGFGIGMCAEMESNWMTGSGSDAYGDFLALNYYGEFEGAQTRGVPNIAYVTRDVFHMVALCLDGSGNPHVYLDGTLVYSDTGGAPYTPYGSLTVGADGSVFLTQRGPVYVSEVAMFPSYISATSIAALWAASHG